MMLKKKVDGLEDYYYQWMNKYKDDADRRLMLLKEANEDRLSEYTSCFSCGRSPVIREGKVIDQHFPDCELAKELADA